MVLGIALSASYDYSGLPATAFIEQGDTKFKVVPALTIGNQCTVVRHAYAAKSWYSVHDDAQLPDSAGALMNTDPSAPAFFVIYASPPDGTTNPPALTFVVKIDYDVRFDQSIVMGPS